MNPIDQTLSRLKRENRIGLMTHVVVGYPSLKKTVEIARVMAAAGADFIELQIPFSDPLADGPTIMSVCEHALQQGMKVDDAFRVARLISREIIAPILFMAYYNTLFKYGVEKFCRDAGRAGVSGLIVPDLSLEADRREHLARYARENNFYFIRVIAPVSTKKRLVKNAEVARGFVYCSARQGVTGVRESLSPKLISYLEKSRRFFNCPLAVGFGISTPAHIKQIFPYADIVVVGSAVIDVIDRSVPKKINQNVRRFIQSLKKASL